MITKRLSVDDLLKAAGAELEAACKTAQFDKHVENAGRICEIINDLIKAEKLTAKKEVEVIECEIDE